MRLDIYHHVVDDNKIVNLLNQVLTKLEQGVKVAESPEMTAFRESVTASLSNISADIQRLLDRPNSLSQEDKDALTAIASNIAAVAAVVPEPEPEV